MAPATGGSACRQDLDFRRADEIVHRQSADIMRGKFHQAATPAELQVRMMVLLLGDEAERIDERQRMHEVGELVCLLYERIAELPAGQGGDQFARAGGGQMMLLALE